MGKSDEQQIKKRAHKATDGESKHKNKPSFDATIFEATNDEGYRQSHWGDHFRQLCEFKVQFGHCLVPNRYSANLKLGQWVARQRSRYSDDREAKSTSMAAEQIRALDGIGFDWGTGKSDLASIWSARFQQLRKFKVQFGHCDVPQKYSANPNLGQWVANQRKNYRLYQDGKPSPMTEERILVLDVMAFKWGASKAAAFWSEQFEQLCAYKVQFGHCAVPQNYSANPRLGQWVKNQRKKYKSYQEGKPSPMTEEYIRELESVGFKWGSRKSDLAPSWSEQFEQLREYEMQFGHCAVPQTYSDNRRLGRWVANQRKNYKLYQYGKPSPMTAERIRALESVGFKRDPTIAAPWTEHFEQLREYKVQFGHCTVPQKYPANPKPGQWVTNQRKNYRLYQDGKPSPMTEERARALESLGFRREPAVGGLWSEQFEQLREYEVKFGHCAVPQNYSAKPKLGQWVRNQRRNYRLYQDGKPSPMTEGRTRLLESVGFERDPTVGGLWSRKFEQLREYKVQFGHCVVPQKYSADNNIGKWVSNQRSNYKLYQEGKPSPMTESRFLALNGIGFKWE
jgi:hypothetical protein